MFSNIPQYTWCYYVWLTIISIIVYAYNSLKNREYLWYQKLSLFNVVCRREYYIYRAGNGILLILTLQASIYVHNMPTISIWDLFFIKNALYGFHYFEYAATLA